MALNYVSNFQALLLILFPFIASVASDPDIVSDFITPPNFFGSINGSFFTYTGLRSTVSEPTPQTFKVTKATLAEFPALDGQSISFAVLEFPPGGINPPHTHPRASELLLVTLGTLEVAFIDTKNVPFTQILRTGDMFVFPKGLVHFQYNRNHQQPAAAVSAFGSANAGTVSVPTSVFGTGIDDVILAKAFKTDVATVMKIKAGITKP
ncbi:hypothetical protein DH2020_030264 [Rehmannia glutinosa]|uniref:Germin-like protein n=1 Tax=Rehmannia glutinosa TaxID=99300 RepID=A0ABR0VLB1_REHGL